MRVLITRPREKADTFAKALIAAGADPVFFPTIQISPVKDPAPLDEALQRLNEFSWVIFTSVNAVEAVWERLEILGIKFSAGMHVAAVGPKTATSLNDRGITPEFVPNRYIAEAILAGLGDLDELHILLPMTDLAHDTLPKAIEAAGGTAHVVTAYRSLPVEADPVGLAALRTGMDIITFTSGSTARNFITLMQTAGLNPFALPGHPQIACIGPKTAAAVRELGFQVDIEADEYTVEGLVQALVKQLSKADMQSR